MEIITSNDNLSITKDKQLYKIEFKYQSYEIINSLLKTRIIRDGITDDSYQTIKFKASSVRTLEQYQEYHNKIYGKKNFKIHIVAYMIRSLAEQLNYLLTYENMTILGYSPKEIIVIDDEKFAFVSSEFIAKIDTEGSEMAMISCPFSYSETDNFFSPEICVSPDPTLTIDPFSNKKLSAPSFSKTNSVNWICGLSVLDTLNNKLL